MAGTIVFTERELQVIRLICRGYTSSEIAAKLKLGQRTIESYRDRIFRKTKVRNVALLVVYAIKNGIYEI